MIVFPEPPPTVERTPEVPLPIRYEDVSQDGRLLLNVLPHGVTAAIWRGLLSDSAIADQIRAEGLVPILTRMVLEGSAGPFAIEPAFAVSGAYELAHSVGKDGEVDRLFLNMWADARGVCGRTYPPQPDHAGAWLPAGRAFHETVFTRLFAPPAERRVVAFDMPGLPRVPPTRYPPHAVDDVLALPHDAETLDPEMALDPLEIAVGVMHTDSNQHVNSLAYPQWFEEAALRRLRSFGRGQSGLARRLEVVFRKPTFAGESLRVALRTYARGEGFGATGVFVDGEEVRRVGDWRALRPRVVIHMEFES